MAIVAAMDIGLNAPYGAPCFLTARRVAPAVTRGNDTSDRQGPKKHESDPHARRQISRLFVAIRRIATDGQQHSSHPEHSRSRRRVAPLRTCTTPHAKHPANLTQARMPRPRPNAAHTPDPTHRGRDPPHCAARRTPASYWSVNPLEVRVQHGHQVVAVPAGSCPAGVVRVLLDA